MRAFSILLAITFLLGLSGCQGLPKSGPNAKDIKKDAVVHRDKKDDFALPYALVDLSPTVVTYFDSPQSTVTRAGFGMGGAPARLIIGVGDTIDVTIFESGAGGLFVPSEAGSRPGNFITLPRQTVDSSGRITVPYAGTLAAAGKTASQLQAQIVARLSNRALDPQVVVTIVESRSFEVSVLGEVNSAGRFVISAGGERVLDAISRAGGVATPQKEMYVTLQRGHRNSTVSFQTLVRNPKTNIFVQPGDVVHVTRDRRTYLAFGAQGQNGRFNFENSHLTLAEAIATAGGLLDDRAEPSAAFLYRHVDQHTASALGIPASKAQGTFPVIIRIDLRDPTMFFLTQRFFMRDNDIVYVDNAKSVKIQKFFNVVNTVADSTVGVAADVTRSVNNN